MARKTLSFGIAVAMLGAGALVPGAFAGGSTDGGSADKARGAIGLGAFHIRGSMGDDDYKITTADNGRFVLMSRGGPITPISPPDGCRVDDARTVSCNEGRVRAVVARLKRGRDTFVATARIRFPTFVIGGAQQDRLIGGRGNDMLRGRLGGDRLVGNRGEDRLIGGEGRDVLVADGDDRVVGGPGNDLVIR